MIVRFESSNTLTVMRRWPGDAKAVPIRRTLRIGSDRRNLFWPHGAFATVCMDCDGIDLLPQPAQDSRFEAESRRRFGMDHQRI
jgi:hypothetical protein